ncbi:MAG TPA: ABC transporter substrate-binding protein [Micromonosporaceae bacterium]|nr:ABC transporter substrate-binding protein [Micromonosporaceae bacterium]
MGDEETNETRARREVAAVNAVAGADPLRLGVITPVTGPGDATGGELVVRGACLGAQYLREQGGVLGGRQVELVLQNDQEGAGPDQPMQRTCVGGMAKLAVYDRVLAALGQWHLRTAPLVAEVAEAFGVPIFIENSHNTVTTRKWRTVFRTYVAISDRLPMMVEFAAERGWRRIAVLAANTVFGQMTADTFQQVAQERGYDMELLRFDFDQETTTDVREQLRRVVDFKPDLLLNSAVVRTNYMVINQAEELGLLPATPMMVGFPFPMRSADYWRLAGAAGNHVIWPALPYRPSWDGLTELGRWFTQRYSDTYGSFPPDNALNAFTDVTIIGQAVQLAGRADREALLDALEAGEFQTWRGPVRFERGPVHWHHSPPEFSLMQYQRVGQTLDEAVVVYPPEAATGEYVHP